jgi:hypothetical protein
MRFLKKRLKILMDLNPGTPKKNIKLTNLRNFINYVKINHQRKYKIYYKYKYQKKCIYILIIKAHFKIIYHIAGFRILNN